MMPRSIALLYVALCLLTGCMAYRETAATVTLMTLGTNTQTMSAGKLSMTGVKQSDTAEKIIKGVVTRSAIGALAPAATRLTGSIGTALENVSKP